MQSSRRLLVTLALVPAACGGDSSSSGQSCSGGTCPPPSSLCVTPPLAASAAAPPTQILALGTKRVGDSVSFSVPAGIASLTIIEQVVSAPPTAAFNEGTVPNEAAPLTLTDPAGTVLFDQFLPPADPTRAPVYLAAASPGTGTLTVPSSTAGLELAASGLPQGTWSLVVSDLAYVCTLAANCAQGGGSNAGTYGLTILLKPSPGAAPARIDVAINLATGDATAITAASAGSDPDLQRMVSSLGVLLARAGLTLGRTTYVDVPPAVASRLAAGVHIDDNGACGDLSRLFATAPAGKQLNVFLVSTFVSSAAPSGTTIVGIDSAIPGPATISPTTQSGVAVSVVNLRAARENCGGAVALDCTPDGSGGASCCGADVTAFFVAHELGHFLGLYHVTEREGVRFDPLEDTPACPCQSCAPDPRTCASAQPAPASPHLMSIAECRASASCGGGDNLMFWVFDDGAVGTVTPEQQRLVSGSPAVY